MRDRTVFVLVRELLVAAGIDQRRQVGPEVATLLRQWTQGDFESLIIQWSGRTDIDANLQAGNKIGGVSLKARWNIGAGTLTSITGCGPARTRKRFRRRAWRKPLEFQPIF